MTTGRSHSADIAGHVRSERRPPTLGDRADPRRAGQVQGHRSARPRSPRPWPSGCAPRATRSSSCPLADGGEGTLDVLGGPNRTTTVTGPLGDAVEAGWRLAGRARGDRDGPGERPGARRRSRGQRCGRGVDPRHRGADRDRRRGGGAPRHRRRRRLGDHRRRARGAAGDVAAAPLPRGRPGGRVRRPAGVRRRGTGVRAAEGREPCAGRAARTPAGTAGAGLPGGATAST